MMALQILGVLGLTVAVGYLYHHGLEGTMRAVALRLLRWAEAGDARKARIRAAQRDTFNELMKPKLAVENQRRAG